MDAHEPGSVTEKGAGQIELQWGVTWTLMSPGL